MKNLFFSVVATVAISAFAAAQSNFVKMNLPRSLQSTSKSYETITKDVTRTDRGGKTIKGQVRLSIPDNGFGLVSAEFTANLLDSKLITPDFFVSYAREGDPTGGLLDPNFSLETCLQGCQERFSDPNGGRLPGRGACKFNCWLVAAARVAEKILVGLALGAI